MTALSTAAWVAHNLGIAVGVGGALFGRVALEPSVREISDQKERGRVLTSAWRRFGAVQMGALGIMGATWLAGRCHLTGREVGASSRGLVLAKDVLVATSIASAIGSAITGNMVAAQQKNGVVPMNNQGEVSASAPPKARRLGRATDAFGLVNLLAGAGIIGVTTILAMSAGKSARWSALSRFLP